MLPLALLAATLTAHAQETGAEAADEPPAIGEGPQRDYMMETNIRVRSMSVPDSVMDIWFFNENDNDGNHPERPSIGGFGLGLEYVIKKDSANGIFYVDYLISRMEEGYWDDVEDPADYTDGDYIKPVGMGLVALGGNYSFEIEFNPGNPNVVVSYLVGGGLGVTFVTGELQKWDSRLNDTGTAIITAYEAYEQDPMNPDDTVRIPSVLPMVDINTGLRFVIAERAVLRLEGGLHNLLYFGGAVGTTF